MSILLCLETSTTVCSVAICVDEKKVALREVNNGYTHSENLTIFIREACHEAGISLKELDAIAVSRGPGSYTGLRIGTSSAKGLCYALEKPLIAVDTLASLSNCFLNLSPAVSAETILVPMIDARRMEVYCAGYDSSLREIFPAKAEIVNADSFCELLNKNKVVLLGDGSGKCKPLFENNPNVSFAEVMISASGMISIAQNKFLKKEFEDVSLFEPFYLKEVAIGNPAG